MEWWWIANGIGATLAVPANVWCIFGATPQVRRMRLAVATIAAVYACGIWWGLSTDRLADWSKVGRVVGVAAWLIVWIWPPIASRRDRERLARNITAMRVAHEGQC